MNNLMFLIDPLPKDTHLVVYIRIYIYVYVHILLVDIRTEIHFWRGNFQLNNITMKTWKTTAIHLVVLDVR